MRHGTWRAVCRLRPSRQNSALSQTQSSDTKRTRRAVFCRQQHRTRPAMASPLRQVMASGRVSSLMSGESASVLSGYRDQGSQKMERTQLDRMFNPRSVAVFGASETSSGVGGAGLCQPACGRVRGKDRAHQSQAHRRRRAEIRRFAGGRGRAHRPCRCRDPGRDRAGHHRPMRCGRYPQCHRPVARVRGKGRRGQSSVSAASGNRAPVGRSDHGAQLHRAGPAAPWA